MRLLHLIPGMAASSGPTEALLQLSACQADLGHSVTIAHLTGRGQEGAYSNHPDVEQLGFPVCCLRHWGYSPALRTWLDTTTPGFDIVHMHSMWLYPNLAASRACRRHGVPYLVRPAGSLEPWCLGVKRFQKALYFRSIERGVLEQAAAIHAVSQQEAENIRLTGLKSRIEVIPNGIALSEYADIPHKAEARQQLGLPNGGPVLLFLSRIHPKKGLDILGHVFRQILSHSPQARLAVVGPDQHSYANEIKLLYQRIGIAAHTVWLGERTGRDKLAAYAAADVFVLPTHSENFGIVVAEALASRLPVVVSNCAPWDCAQEAGAGFCVDLDASVFTSCILEILRSPERARTMGEAGRKLISERFDWRAVSRRILSLYDDVIETRATHWGANPR